VKVPGDGRKPGERVKEADDPGDAVAEPAGEICGGKTAVAAANMEFTPIAISRPGESVSGEQGWFGDKGAHVWALAGGQSRRWRM